MKQDDTARKVKYGPESSQGSICASDAEEIYEESENDPSLYDKYTDSSNPPGANSHVKKRYDKIRRKSDLRKQMNWRQILFTEREKIKSKIGEK